MSPINDTLYVMGPLDLSGGPLALHTPDAGNRYDVLQFVDAWSNNVAYGSGGWLPTPHGDFRPILRMYEPGPGVLDGTYSMPPIVRDD